MGESMGGQVNRDGKLCKWWGCLRCQWPTEGLNIKDERAKHGWIGEWLFFKHD